MNRREEFYQNISFPALKEKKSNPYPQELSISCILFFLYFIIKFIYTSIISPQYSIHSHENVLRIEIIFT